MARSKRGSEPRVAVADTFGIARHVSGKWFSLSEEAFSPYAALYPTEADAKMADDRHHGFMLENHPEANGRAPYVERAEA
jgi:hypothetical protein